MNLLLTLSYSFVFVVSAGSAVAESGSAVQTARWLAAVSPAGDENQVPTPVTVVTNDAPVASSSDGTGGSDMHIVLAADHRRVFGGDYSSLSEVRIGVEFFEGRHVGFGMFAVAGVLELEEGSAVRAVAHTPLILGWGIGGHYHFTPRKTFLRPYVIASLSWLWMNWSYREDVSTGGETVDSDSKQGLDGYAGVGLLVGSNKRLNLFGEIGAGGVVFYGTTEHEVNNDLFDDFGYVGVKAGLRIRF